MLRVEHSYLSKCRIKREQCHRVKPGARGGRFDFRAVDILKTDAHANKPREIERLAAVTRTVGLQQFVGTFTAFERAKT